MGCRRHFGARVRCKRHPTTGQGRIVPSALADTSVAPSGEMAMACTDRSCPRKMRRIRPLVGSHARQDPSTLAVTTQDQRRPRHQVAGERPLPCADGRVELLTDVRQPLDRRALRELVENFADPTVGAVTGELKIPRGGSGEQSDLDRGAVRRGLVSRVSNGGILIPILLWVCLFS